MSIYKPCDIRGHFPTELTPELYRGWGRALGRRLKAKEKFVVGGDVRFSTPEFLAALVDGLCQAGADVVDLGVLPTPMVYYAKRRLRAAACAIVTASHNPPDFNGLKWMLGDVPPTQEEVAELEHAAGSTAPKRPRRRKAGPRSLDVTFDYVAWLQETWVEARTADFPIVLDPMHGCLAGRARRYLHAVFPRMLIEALHDEADPAFGDRHPDCSRTELLQDLSDAVYRHRARLGIAFDGDGDRVAFVDDEGTPLSAEETTWVLLRSFPRPWSGQAFVYDVKFSDRVAEAARQLGAEPVVERSGHAFIRTRMLRDDALFGAEVSGHYFYRQLGGGDDGLFTACRLMAHLAESGRRLSELRRECPPVFMTPDLRIPIELEEQQEVLREVRRQWADQPQTAIDGVRVSFPDGWALVRSSITEPALTFRFEAANQRGLDKLVWHFCDGLADLGDSLWARYEEAKLG